MDGVDHPRGARPELSPRIRSPVEPKSSLSSNCLRQADRDDCCRADGLPTEEREEIRHLHRANETLREEREPRPLLVPTDYRRRPRQLMPSETPADEVALL